jgi:hypothetical protein
MMAMSGSGIKDIFPLISQRLIMGEDDRSSNRQVRSRHIYAIVEEESMANSS